MGEFKIRYLIGRRQKGGHVLWYWQPSAALRREGWLPRRLAERTNDLVDAIAEAERFNRELDDWRAGRRPEVIPHGSLPWLVRLYRDSPKWKRLRPRTQRSYNEAIKRLEEWSRAAGHPAIESYNRRAVKAYQRTLSERSTHKAKKVLTVLGILFKFAVNEGLLKENTATKLDLEGGNRRERVWSHEEVEAFCATAHARGRPSIALAVLLALNLGQREGDILALTWAQIQGDAIRIRQAKTRAVIEVPIIAELAAELDRTSRRAPAIVVSGTTGRPYGEHNFRHRFAEIREAAGLPDDLLFMDLRRTAVVRLGEAGCSVPEIAAVTGHSLKTAASILEIYLPRNAVMARHAVAKLEEYRAKIGSSDREAGGGVGRMVPRGGFEPPTRGFSVRCSTN